MNPRHRLVLRAFAVWTIWIWGTRIWNIVGDEGRTTGFKVVHIVLALVSVGFAVATLVITARSTRAASTSEPRQPVSTS
ncbi:MAG: hypothetical protein M3P34_05705 [Actinomycetota bacterium]|nr:hypothetical protein [Actinomycetota bacterium]